MVRLVGPYRYIDQLSVRYIPSCPDVSTYGTVGYTDILVCTIHTSPLLDRYISPIPSGML